MISCYSSSQGMQGHLHYSGGNCAQIFLFEPRKTERKSPRIRRRLAGRALIFDAGGALVRVGAGPGLDRVPVQDGCMLLTMLFSRSISVIQDAY